MPNGASYFDQAEIHAQLKSTLHNRRQFPPFHQTIGKHQETKPYSSGKHHLYGIETEVLVSPNEFAIFAIAHYPGAKLDLAIFRDISSVTAHSQKKMWR